MNNKLSYSRIYLSESKRKELQIDWRNKTFYIYKLNNKVYISKNIIPRSLKYKTIKAKIVYGSWCIPIPEEFVPSLNTTTHRYALTSSSEDNLTQQLIRVSSRLLLKRNKNGEKITKISTRRCKKTGKYI